MIRKALIIASPCSGENNLPGVLKDAQNYKNFLLSAMGGGWYDNEIIIINNPTSDVLETNINELILVDYSMIIFAGHGCSINNETHIWINDNEKISSQILKKYAKKRTIILDCCREVQDIVFESFIESRILEFAQKQPDIILARKYYEECINAVSESVVIMNACSLNEYSNESELGGDYTYSLIEQSQKWCDKQISKSFLSVVLAHQLAVEIIAKKSDGRQNPQIERIRSSPYFPFAIKI